MILPIPDFKVEIINCNKFIGLSNVSQAYLKYLCLKENFKRRRYIGASLGYSSTFLKVAESASKDA